MDVCKHACMCVYMYVYAYVYVCICICVCVCICICICMCICICAHATSAPEEPGGEANNVSRSRARQVWCRLALSVSAAPLTARSACRSSRRRRPFVRLYVLLCGHILLVLLCLCSHCLYVLCFSPGGVDLRKGCEHQPGWK